MSQVARISAIAALTIGAAIVGSTQSAYAQAPVQPLTLNAPGINLQALADGRVVVHDGAGVERLTLGGYKLVWSPPETDGGTSSLITLPDGRQAIQVAYKVKGDPTGAVRMQGQFSADVGRVHIRMDIWCPDGVKTEGGMIGCAATPADTPVQTIKLARWTRDAAGGVPYEAKDTELFGYQWADAGGYLSLHGNTSWRDPWSMHFPPSKVEAGHYVAEGDMVLTNARPAAASALLAGRTIAIDAWTDRDYNLQEPSAKPFVVHAQAFNASASAQTIVLSWTAHDFSGKIVLQGEERQVVAAGTAWDRPIAIPSPKSGIVFVEITAAGKAESAFTRTNLGVLPPRSTRAPESSIFGISGFFPLPSETAAEGLLTRIGVRWSRVDPIAPDRATALGIAQNHHSNIDHSKTDDRSKVDAWVEGELAKADKHGAHYWELCNEWNMAALNTGKGADNYVQNVLIPADQARVRLSAKVKIMSMGLAGGDIAYIDAMHDAGAWDHFDAVAFHPGRGNHTPDYGVPGTASENIDYWNFLGTIQKVKAAVARYGAKPLWITEAYACTKPNGWWNDTMRHAAENVVLSYALALSEGITAMDWYQLNDSVWYDQGGVNPTDSEYHYGLLNRDLSPKPSLLAYATASAALGDAKFVRWIHFDNALNKGLLFNTPRGPMAILWNRAEGYTLNPNHAPKATFYPQPEAWVDEWKTKTSITVPASSTTIRVIDCVGREEIVSARGGRATVVLDGAPRIYYGISNSIGQ